MGASGEEVEVGVFGGWVDVGVLGGGWTRESGGGQVRGGWTDELVYLVSVGGLSHHHHVVSSNYLLP